MGVWLGDDHRKGITHRIYPQPPKPRTILRKPPPQPRRPPPPIIHKPVNQNQPPLTRITPVVVQVLVYETARDVEPGSGVAGGGVGLGGGVGVEEGEGGLDYGGGE